MERMRYHEPEPRRVEHSAEKSQFEQFFFISPGLFERQTGISPAEVSRVTYSPDRNRFSAVESSKAMRSPEALWHRESSTLVVPPPTGGVLTVADLAAMSVPVAGFIRQTQPDIVIGCDRGARLYGVAVHSMFGDLESKGQRFPTLDGKMHFARLSTSLGLDITSEALSRIVQKSAEEATIQGKQQNGERLRLMFIDDWISSGATRRQILASLETIGVLQDVDVSFAVMCGSGGDVSGGKGKGSVFWHDDPNVIGINYTRDGQPYPVRTLEARKTRRNIHRATNEVTARIKKKQKRK